MTRISSQVLDEFDRPVQGAQVYVLKIDGTQATLTLDGGGPLLQPINSDTFGSYYYNTADSIYRREIWYGGKKRWVEQLIDTPLDATLRTDLSASTGSSLVNWIGSLTGAVSRLVRDKLRDIVAVPDFSSHAVADAAGATLYVPADVTSTRANGSAVVSVHWGPGRLTTADGNKRGNRFTNVTAAPSSLGNHNSIETAFNGDLSKSLDQGEYRITGAATLSQPTSGYVYTPEVYPHYSVLYNTSGWNNSTSGNTGRTGACAYRVNLQQSGQGDLVAFNFTGIVSGSRAGATSFLANPAVCGLNGDLTAGNDGVYLDPDEVVLHDAGHDIAAVGVVRNLDRNNITGALGCWWGGVRVQSIGTVAINSVVSATGKVSVGVDFTPASLDFGTNKTAVSLKDGDRISFHDSSSNGTYLTTFGGYYIEYSVAATALNLCANNTSVLQVAADRVTMVKPPVLPTVAVASLPSAATRAGMEYYVSDANATTRLSTVAGGGANFVKVFSNGTNWLIQ